MSPDVVIEATIGEVGTQLEAVLDSGVFELSVTSPKDVSCLKKAVMPLHGALDKLRNLALAAKKSGTLSLSQDQKMSVARCLVVRGDLAMLINQLEAVTNPPKISGVPFPLKGMIDPISTLITIEAVDSTRVSCAGKLEALSLLL